MYVKFKKNEQKKLMKKALQKAGSERALEKILKIPKISIYFYKNEKRNLPLKSAKQITEYLGLEFSSLNPKINRLLDKNWGRRKGGKICAAKKIESGEIMELVKKMGIGSSKWHKEMKAKKEEEYYKIQYKKFKKISDYKYKTLRGEKVRNKLEKEVADFLYKVGTEYAYEEYTKANGNSYFPDFKFDNKVIECTFWKGYQKVPKLKKKVKDLEKEGYIVYVYVPNNLQKYYKPLTSYLIDSPLKILPL